MKQAAFNKFIKVLKLVGKVFLILLMFFYVLMNLFFSQNISPLFARIAKEDKDAVISFLSQIKNLGLFDRFLNINKNIYGDSLEKEVFAESLKRKQTISDYEKLLHTNPDSRDILYNLYILYLEEGNEIKAAEYLKLAKNIDPSLGQ